MKAWWESLAPREQRLVMALLPVVAVAVFYFALWQPLSRGAEQSAQQMALAQRDLAWMKEQAERVLSAAPRSAGKSDGSLSTIVNQIAGSRGITISRLQPQGEALQVWIDEVAWGDLLGFLEMLKRDHGVQVTSVDLARSDVPGLVKVRRLELTRG